MPGCRGDGRWLPAAIQHRFGRQHHRAGGPGGATPDKPIGLVFVGLAWTGGVLSTSFNWTGTRTEIQSRCAKQALNAVRLKLLET